ncbi:hypothetical protein LEP1GSC151_5608 [Leptospira interrogans serovar Grippotyphosa str. LT2186]|uniref:Uncharacterized protein n=1 Tax=Leptospira interrogans serovar Grippotyphosa str. LT2186 TaxID=1001599 RepID=M3HYF5_LEPIR|nr:hypothetical protein LEP1GSC151_5608 [Leptospira interrogans serovar Grippotyphosa str. LT2186]
MNLSYSSVGTITKFRFVCKMMWDVSITKSNSKKRIITK